MTALAVAAYPATAAGSPQLQLSGRSSGFVDITLRAPLPEYALMQARLTGGRGYVGLCLQRRGEPRVRCAVKIAAAAYPSDPAEPVLFGSPAVMPAGRYRAFLLADAQATVTLPLPGATKSIVPTRLSPLRTQVAVADMALAPAPMVAGQARLPLQVRETTVATVGVRWESAAPMGAFRVAACLVSAGKLCEQTSAPPSVVTHDGPGYGTYAVSYDADGVQQLGATPEATADLAGADLVTFAKLFLIAFHG